MRNRESLLSNKRTLKFSITAAALILLGAVLAAAFLLLRPKKEYLVLTSVDSGEEYAAYPVKTGDEFGIGFIHSVNKSPLTDYYEVREDGIYVVRTVYYGFGAGVQTELEGNETLEYGEDGSMIVSGFDRKMNDLIYFVGTVSDHTLTLPDGSEISLRDLCGRNACVRFDLEQR